MTPLVPGIHTATMSLAHPHAGARRSGSVLRRIAAATLVVLLAGCATRTPASVEERRAAPPPKPVAAPAAVPAPALVPAPAPVPETDGDARPQTYTVKRGDTLHAIALDLGLDYRELAAWNNLENPNLIRIGQVLRVRPPGEQAADAPGPGVTTLPLRPAAPIGAGDARASAAPPASPAPAGGPRNAENYKSQPKALKEPYSEQALRDMQRNAVAASLPADAAPPAPAVVARADPALPRSDAKPPAPADAGDDKLDWLWPTVGKLVTGFSDTANLKGIDIAGKAGQPVIASAAGKVVYAGSGLRGYGKLVIVKHNDMYLSAYAHNSEILVKEGQVVTRGQKIAEMGNSDSEQVKLHFEIRRQGKPVDPLKFLPPA